MSAVNLVAVTKPNEEYTGARTPEDLVSWCARVSNPSNQSNYDTAPRLISYLARNKHWSPFEMASMAVEIKTTRDIARQILRHRSFSFQEYSQRYADPTADLNMIAREARLQDHKNRQNSVDTDDLDLEVEWVRVQGRMADEALAAYKWAIGKGIAKEVARSVLPEGLTESVLIMSGTVRSWIHYVELRSGNGTQKEHREIAVKCKDILLGQFPGLESIMSQETK